MKPIIGITMHSGEGKQEVNAPYIKSIIQAGGIPVCIPHIREGIDEVLTRLNGLLLIGGGDMNPASYGENPHPQTGAIVTERDESDLELMKQALKQNLPVLAICRGLQVLNVAFGGTLYQDIPSEVEGAVQHTQKSARYEKVHPITVKEGTKLFSITGGEIMTNTFHHQSAKELGRGLIVSARAHDGIIEAIEHPEYAFCLGVQWHPEETAVYGDGVSVKLFEAFIQACR